ncbi:MAG: hypothetical protein WCU74_09235 [Candidatus Omnitrophota bacterium]
MRAKVPRKFVSTLAQPLGDRRQLIHLDALTGQLYVLTLTRDSHGVEAQASAAARLSDMNITQLALQLPSLIFTEEEAKRPDARLVAAIEAGVRPFGQDRYVLIPVADGYAVVELVRVDGEVTEAKSIGIIPSNGKGRGIGAEPIPSETTAAFMEQADEDVRARYRDGVFADFGFTFGNYEETPAGEFNAVVQDINSDGHLLPAQGPGIDYEAAVNAAFGEPETGLGESWSMPEVAGERQEMRSTGISRRDFLSHVAAVAGAGPAVMATMGAASDEGIAAAAAEIDMENDVEVFLDLLLMPTGGRAVEFLRRERASPRYARVSELQRMALAAKSGLQARTEGNFLMTVWRQQQQRRSGGPAVADRDLIGLYPGYPDEIAQSMIAIAKRRAGELLREDHRLARENGFTAATPGQMMTCRVPETRRAYASMVSAFRETLLTGDGRFLAEQAAGSQVALDFERKNSFTPPALKDSARATGYSEPMLTYAREILQTLGFEPGQDGMWNEQTLTENFIAPLMTRLGFAWGDDAYFETRAREIFEPLRKAYRVRQVNGKVYGMADDEFDRKFAGDMKRAAAAMKHEMQRAAGQGVSLGPNEDPAWRQYVIETYNPREMFGDGLTSEDCSDRFSKLQRERNQGRLETMPQVIAQEGRVIGLGDEARVDAMFAEHPEENFWALQTVGRDEVTKEFNLALQGPRNANDFLRLLVLSLRKVLEISVKSKTLTRNSQVHLLFSDVVGNMLKGSDMRLLQEKFAQSHPDHPVELKNYLGFAVMAAGNMMEWSRNLYRYHDFSRPEQAKKVRDGARHAFLGETERFVRNQVAFLLAVPEVLDDENGMEIARLLGLGKEVPGKTPDLSDYNRIIDKLEAGRPMTVEDRTLWEFYAIDVATDMNRFYYYFIGDLREAANKAVQEFMVRMFPALPQPNAADNVSWTPPVLRGLAASTIRFILHTPALWWPGEPVNLQDASDVLDTRAAGIRNGVLSDARLRRVFDLLLHRPFQDMMDRELRRSFGPAAMHFFEEFNAGKYEMGLPQFETSLNAEAVVAPDLQARFNAVWVEAQRMLREGLGTPEWQSWMNFFSAQWEDLSGRRPDELVMTGNEVYETQMRLHYQGIGKAYEMDQFILHKEFYRWVEAGESVGQINALLTSGKAEEARRLAARYSFRVFGKTVANYLEPVADGAGKTVSYRAISLDSLTAQLNGVSRMKLMGTPRSPGLLESVGDASGYNIIGVTLEHFVREAKMFGIYANLPPGPPGSKYPTMSPDYATLNKIRKLLDGGKTVLDDPYPWELTTTVAERRRGIQAGFLDRVLRMMVQMKLNGLQDIVKNAVDYSQYRAQPLDDRTLREFVRIREYGFDIAGAASWFRSGREFNPGDPEMRGSVEAASFTGFMTGLDPRSLNLLYVFLGNLGSGPGDSGTRSRRVRVESAFEKDSLLLLDLLSRGKLLKGMDPSRPLAPGIYTGKFGSNAEGFVLAMAGQFMVDRSTPGGLLSFIEAVPGGLPALVRDADDYWQEMSGLLQVPLPGLAGRNFLQLDAVSQGRLTIFLSEAAKEGDLGRYQAILKEKLAELSKPGVVQALVKAINDRLDADARSGDQARPFSISPDRWRELQDGKPFDVSEILSSADLMGRFFGKLTDMIGDARRDPMRIPVQPLKLRTSARRSEIRSAGKVTRRTFMKAVGSLGFVAALQALSPRDARAVLKDLRPAPGAEVYDPSKDPIDRMIYEVMTNSDLSPVNPDHLPNFDRYAEDILWRLSKATSGKLSYSVPFVTEKLLAIKSYAGIINGMVTAQVTRGVIDSRRAGEGVTDAEIQEIQAYLKGELFRAAITALKNSLVTGEFKSFHDAVLRPADIANAKLNRSARRLGIEPLPDSMNPGGEMEQLILSIFGPKGLGLPIGSGEEDVVSVATLYGNFVLPLLVRHNLMLREDKKIPLRAIRLMRLWDSAVRTSLAEFKKAGPKSDLEVADLFTSVLAGEFMEHEKTELERAWSKVRREKAKAGEGIPPVELKKILGMGFLFAWQAMVHQDSEFTHLAIDHAEVAKLDKLSRSVGIMSRQIHYWFDRASRPNRLLFRRTWFDEAGPDLVQTMEYLSRAMNEPYDPSAPLQHRLRRAAYTMAIELGILGAGPLTWAVPRYESLRPQQYAFEFIKALFPALFPEEVVRDGRVVNKVMFSSKDTNLLLMGAHADIMALLWTLSAQWWRKGPIASDVGQIFLDLQYRQLEPILLSPRRKKDIELLRRSTWGPKAKRLLDDFTQGRLKPDTTVKEDHRPLDPGKVADSVSSLIAETEARVQAGLGTPAWLASMKYFIGFLRNMPATVRRSEYPPELDEYGLRYNERFLTEEVPVERSEVEYAFVLTILQGMLGDLLSDLRNYTRVSRELEAAGVVEDADLVSRATGRKEQWTADQRYLAGLMNPMTLMMDHVSMFLYGMPYDPDKPTKAGALQATVSDMYRRGKTPELIRTLMGRMTAIEPATGKRVDSKEEKQILGILQYLTDNDARIAGKLVTELYNDPEIGSNVVGFFLSFENDALVENSRNPSGDFTADFLGMLQTLQRSGLGVRDVMKAADDYWQQIADMFGVEMPRILRDGKSFLDLDANSQGRLMIFLKEAAAASDWNAFLAQQMKRLAMVGGRVGAQAMVDQLNRDLLSRSRKKPELNPEDYRVNWPNAQMETKWKEKYPGGWNERWQKFLAGEPFTTAEMVYSEQMMGELQGRLMTRVGDSNLRPDEVPAEQNLPKPWQKEPVQRKEIRSKEEGLQFTRRDVLKAGAIGAAAVGLGSLTAAGEAVAADLGGTQTVPAGMTGPEIFGRGAMAPSGTQIPVRQQPLMVAAVPADASAAKLPAAANYATMSSDRIDDEINAAMSPAVSRELDADVRLLMNALGYAQGTGTETPFRTAWARSRIREGEGAGFGPTVGHAELVAAIVREIAAPTKALAARIVYGDETKVKMNADIIGLVCGLATGIAKMYGMENKPLDAAGIKGILERFLAERDDRDGQDGVLTKINNMLELVKAGFINDPELFTPRSTGLQDSLMGQIYTHLTSPAEAPQSGKAPKGYPLNAGDPRAMGWLMGELSFAVGLTKDLPPNFETFNALSPKEKVRTRHTVLLLAVDRAKDGSYPNKLEVQTLLALIAGEPGRKMNVRDNAGDLGFLGNWVSQKINAGVDSGYAKTLFERYRDLLQSPVFKEYLKKIGFSDDFRRDLALYFREIEKKALNQPYDQTLVERYYDLMGLISYYVGQYSKVSDLEKLLKQRMVMMTQLQGFAPALHQEMLEVHRFAAKAVEQAKGSKDPGRIAAAQAELAKHPAPDARMADARSPQSSSEFIKGLFTGLKLPRPVTLGDWTADNVYDLNEALYLFKVKTKYEREKRVWNGEAITRERHNFQSYFFQMQASVFDELLRRYPRPGVRYADAVAELVSKYRSLIGGLSGYPVHEEYDAGMKQQFSNFLQEMIQERVFDNDGDLAAHPETVKALEEYYKMNMLQVSVSQWYVRTMVKQPYDKKLLTMEEVPDKIRFRKLAWALYRKHWDPIGFTANTGEISFVAEMAWRGTPELASRLGLHKVTPEDMMEQFFLDGAKVFLRYRKYLQRTLPFDSLINAISMAETSQRIWHRSLGGRTDWITDLREDARLSRRDRAVEAKLTDMLTIAPDDQVAETYMGEQLEVLRMALQQFSEKMHMFPPDYDFRESGVYGRSETDIFLRFRGVLLEGFRSWQWEEAIDDGMPAAEQDRVRKRNEEKKRQNQEILRDYMNILDNLSGIPRDLERVIFGRAEPISSETLRANPEIVKDLVIRQLSNRGPRKMLTHEEFEIAENGENPGALARHFIKKFKLEGIGYDFENKLVLRTRKDNGKPVTAEEIKAIFEDFMAVDYLLFRNSERYGYDLEEDQEINRARVFSLVVEERMNGNIPQILSMKYSITEYFLTQKRDHKPTVILEEEQNSTLPEDLIDRWLDANQITARLGSDAQGKSDRQWLRDRLVEGLATGSLNRVTAKRLLLDLAAMMEIFQREEHELAILGRKKGVLDREKLVDFIRLIDNVQKLGLQANGFVDPLDEEPKNEREKQLALEVKGARRFDATRQFENEFTIRVRMGTGDTPRDVISRMQADKAKPKIEKGIQALLAIFTAVGVHHVLTAFRATIQASQRRKADVTLTDPYTYREIGKQKPHRIKTRFFPLGATKKFLSYIFLHRLQFGAIGFVVAKWILDWANVDSFLAALYLWLFVTISFSSASIVADFLGNLRKRTPWRRIKRLEAPRAVQGNGPAQGPLAPAGDVPAPQVSAPVPGSKSPAAPERREMRTSAPSPAAMAKDKIPANRKGTVYVPTNQGKAGIIDEVLWRIANSAAGDLDPQSVQDLGNALEPFGLYRRWVQLTPALGWNIDQIAFFIVREILTPSPNVISTPAQRTEGWVAVFAGMLRKDQPALTPEEARVQARGRLNEWIAAGDEAGLMRVAREVAKSRKTRAIRDILLVDARALRQDEGVRLHDRVKAINKRLNINIVGLLGDIGDHSEADLKAIREAIMDIETVMGIRIQTFPRNKPADFNQDADTKIIGKSTEKDLGVYDWAINLNKKVGSIIQRIKWAAFGIGTPTTAYDLLVPRKQRYLLAPFVALPGGVLSLIGYFIFGWTFALWGFVATMVLAGFLSLIFSGMSNETIVEAHAKRSVFIQHQVYADLTYYGMRMEDYPEYFARYKQQWNEFRGQQNDSPVDREFILDHPQVVFPLANLRIQGRAKLEGHTLTEEQRARLTPYYIDRIGEAPLTAAQIDGLPSFVIRAILGEDYEDLTPEVVASETFRTVVNALRIWDRDYQEVDGRFMAQRQAFIENYGSANLDKFVPDSSPADYPWYVRLAHAIPFLRPLTRQSAGFEVMPLFAGAQAEEVKVNDLMFVDELEEGFNRVFGDQTRDDKNHSGFISEDNGVTIQMTGREWGIREAIRQGLISRATQDDRALKTPALRREAAQRMAEVLIATLPLTVAREASLTSWAMAEAVRALGQTDPTVTFRSAFLDPAVTSSDAFLAELAAAHARIQALVAAGDRDELSRIALEAVIARRLVENEMMTFHGLYDGGLRDIRRNNQDAVIRQVILRFGLVLDERLPDATRLDDFYPVLETEDIRETPLQVGWFLRALFWFLGLFNIGDITQLEEPANDFERSQDPSYGTIGDFSDRNNWLMNFMYEKATHWMPYVKAVEVGSHPDNQWAGYINQYIEVGGGETLWQYKNSQEPKTGAAFADKMQTIMDGEDWSIRWAYRFARSLGLSDQWFASHRLAQMQRGVDSQYGKAVGVNNRLGRGTEPEEGNRMPGKYLMGTSLGLIGGWILGALFLGIPFLGMLGFTGFGPGLWAALFWGIVGTQFGRLAGIWEGRFFSGEMGIMGARMLSHDSFQAAAALCIASVRSAVFEPACANIEEHISRAVRWMLGEKYTVEMERMIGALMSSRHHHRMAWTSYLRELLFLTWLLPFALVLSITYSGFVQTFAYLQPLLEFHHPEMSFSLMMYMLVTVVFLINFLKPLNEWAIQDKTHRIWTVAGGAALAGVLYFLGGFAGWALLVLTASALLVAGRWWGYSAQKEMNRVSTMKRVWAVLLSTGIFLSLPIILGLDFIRTQWRYYIVDHEPYEYTPAIPATSKLAGIAVGAVSVPLMVFFPQLLAALAVPTTIQFLGLSISLSAAWWIAAPLLFLTALLSFRYSHATPFMAGLLMVFGAAYLAPFSPAYWSLALFTGFFLAHRLSGRYTPVPWFITAMVGAAAIWALPFIVSGQFAWPVFLFLTAKINLLLSTLYFTPVSFAFIPKWLVVAAGSVILLNYGFNLAYKIFWQSGGYLTDTMPWTTFLIAGGKKLLNLNLFAEKFEPSPLAALFLIISGMFFWSSQWGLVFTFPLMVAWLLGPYLGWITSQKIREVRTPTRTANWWVDHIYYARYRAMFPRGVWAPVVQKLPAGLRNAVTAVRQSWAGDLVYFLTSPLRTLLGFTAGMLMSLVFTVLLAYTNIANLWHFGKHWAREGRSDIREQGKKGWIDWFLAISKFAHDTAQLTGFALGVVLSYAALADITRFYALVPSQPVVKGIDLASYIIAAVSTAIAGPILTGKIFKVSPLFGAALIYATVMFFVTGSFSMPLGMGTGMLLVYFLTSPKLWYKLFSVLITLVPIRRRMVVEVRKFRYAYGEWRAGRGWNYEIPAERRAGLRDELQSPPLSFPSAWRWTPGAVLRFAMAGVMALAAILGAIAAKLALPSKPDAQAPPAAAAPAPDTGAKALSLPAPQDRADRVRRETVNSHMAYFREGRGLMRVTYAEGMDALIPLDRINDKGDAVAFGRDTRYSQPMVLGMWLNILAHQAAGDPYDRQAYDARVELEKFLAFLEHMHGYYSQTQTEDGSEVPYSLGFIPWLQVRPDGVKADKKPAMQVRGFEDFAGMAAQYMNAMGVLDPVMARRVNGLLQTMKPGFAVMIDEEGRIAGDVNWMTGVPVWHRTIVGDEVRSIIPVLAAYYGWDSKVMDHLSLQISVYRDAEGKEYLIWAPANGDAFRVAFNLFHNGTEAEDPLAKQLYRNTAEAYWREYVASGGSSYFPGSSFTVEKSPKSGKYYVTYNTKAGLQGEKDIVVPQYGLMFSTVLPEMVEVSDEIAKASGLANGVMLGLPKESSHTIDGKAVAAPEHSFLAGVALLALYGMEDPGLPIRQFINSEDVHGIADLEGKVKAMRQRLLDPARIKKETGLKVSPAPGLPSVDEMRETIRGMREDRIRREGETIPATSPRSEMRVTGEQVKTRWDRRMQEWTRKDVDDATFGYGEPEAVRDRVVAGNRGYRVVTNPGRRQRELRELAKRGSRVDTTPVMAVRTDPQAINFNAILEKSPGQNLFAADELDEDGAILNVNQNWIIPRSALWIPAPEKNLPQRMTEEVLAAALKRYEKVRSAGAWMGFNSLGANASINHMHLHEVYEERTPQGQRESLAIEMAERAFVANLDGNILAEQLVGYPMHAMVYTGLDKDQLVRHAIALILKLQDQDVPHFVMIMGDSIYVVPSERGEAPPEIPRGPAVMEAAGRFNLPQEAEPALTEEDWDRVLAPYSLKSERFDPLVDAVKSSAPSATKAERAESRDVAPAIVEAVGAVSEMKTPREERLGKITARADALGIRLEEALAGFMTDDGVREALGIPSAPKTVERAKVYVDVANLGPSKIDDKIEILMAIYRKAAAHHKASRTIKPVKLILFGASPDEQVVLRNKLREQGFEPIFDQARLANFIRDDADRSSFRQIKTDRILPADTLKQALVGALDNPYVVISSTELGLLDSQVTSVASILKAIFTVHAGREQAAASA